MSEPVAANSQRHLSLLMRLSGASEPLSSVEIFQSVVGYRPEPGEVQAGQDALEKRFERDRKLLASLGFPIQTVVDPEAPGDRSRWRFELARASREASGTSASSNSFSVTAEQLLLIDAATRVWQEDGIAADARRAYFKLLATSTGTEHQDLPEARITQRRRTGTQFTQLRDAIALQQDVEFEYAKPGSVDAETRSVAPLQLVQVEGYWLCNCFDYVRGAERNFLLRRIVGDVRTTGPRTTDYQPRTNLAAQLRELGAQQAATVTVERGSLAEVTLGHRALARGSDDTAVWLRIPSWDHELLADELAGLASDIRSIEPASLAERVDGRLAKVVTLHGSASRGGADGSEV